MSGKAKVVFVRVMGWLMLAFGLMMVLAFVAVAAEEGFDAVSVVLILFFAGVAFAGFVLARHGRKKRSVAAVDPEELKQKEAERKLKHDNAKAELKAKREKEKQEKADGKWERDKACAHAEWDRRQRELDARQESGAKGLLDKILDMEIPGTKNISLKEPANSNDASKAIQTNRTSASSLPGHPASGSNRLWEGIPEDVKRLLFVSNADRPKMPGMGISITITMDFSGRVNTSENLPDDPSTVYRKAPISEPADPAQIPGPPYYPAYAELTPEQRYVYLSWLQDISADIDLGYKFLFYYGLERHLCVGDFDNAYDMIIRLRKNTQNNSFLSYSGNALIYSLLIRNRPDLFHKLKFMYGDDKWHERQLWVKTFTDDTINADELMRILKAMDVNKRYIVNEPKVYQELMDALLFDKYGHPYINTNDYIGKGFTRYSEEILFANISFPENVRHCRKTPALDTVKFYECVAALHEQCHEATKKRLAESRRGKKVL